MLALGEAGVILLEVGPGCLVVLVLVVGEGEEVESILGFLGAFEYGGNVFEGGSRLGVFFLFKCSFREIEAIVGVVAFEYALVFATEVTATAASSIRRYLYIIIMVCCLSVCVSTRKISDFL